MRPAPAPRSRSRTPSLTRAGFPNGELRVIVNRAPVLTLWATVVAQRLGFDRDEALTLGRVVAGLNAYSKGSSLGIFKPTPEEVKRERKRVTPGAIWHVELLHRAVPVVQTAEDLRALSKDKPIDPGSVQRCLDSKFGAELAIVKEAMSALARSLAPEELGRLAYEMYEAFRPEIPAGAVGWGAAGVLDLAHMRALARSLR